MIDDINKEKEKLPNATQFSMMIELLSLDLGVPLMETITHYCEKNNIEVETAAKLLNKSIKSKLQTEAEDLNFLPRSARLF